ncbi:MAG: 4Fe-4S binding protein [Desulfovibrionales bacterium]
MFPMTSAVFRNLIKGSATRLYPAIKRDPFEGVRGTVKNDLSGCIFCGICERTCPSSCITVLKKQKVWKYDSFSCIFCGHCAEKCPTGSVVMEKEHPLPLEKFELIELTAPPEEE